MGSRGAKQNECSVANIPLLLSSEFPGEQSDVSRRAVVGSSKRIKFQADSSSKPSVVARISQPIASQAIRRGTIPSGKKNQTTNKRFFVKSASLTLGLLNRKLAIFKAEFFHLFVKRCPIDTKLIGSHASVPTVGLKHVENNLSLGAF